MKMAIRLTVLSIAILGSLPMFGMQRLVSRLATLRAPATKALKMGGALRNAHTQNNTKACLRTAHAAAVNKKSRHILAAKAAAAKVKQPNLKTNTIQQSAGSHNQWKQDFPRSPKAKLSLNRLVLAGLVGLTSTGLALSDQCEIWKEKLTKLTEDQYQKQNKMLDTVPDEHLTGLCKWEYGRSWIYLNKGENCDNLKKLFDDKGLVTFYCLGINKAWTNEDWAIAANVIVANAHKRNNSTHFNTLSYELLASAKSILKSYIPNENIDGLTVVNKPDRSRDPYRKKDSFVLNDKIHFVNKHGQIARLFVHAKLQKVINERKLLHVHLPLKILVVKDIKNGKYIVGKEALKILDENLKIVIRDSGIVYAQIELVSDKYALKVLAQKQDCASRLSENAFKDLETLIEEVPFDPAFPNIFSKANGDAVIIDTEFKDHGVDFSLAILHRAYPDWRIIK